LLRESKVKFNLPDDREDDGKNNETSSAFVTAGNFQVPLFEGAVDRTTLDEIASISGEEGFDAAIRHVLVAKGKEVLRRRAKGEVRTAIRVKIVVLLLELPYEGGGGKLS